jgi:predicted dehydrogenase
MSNKLRIGVIGTSWWADMVHLPVFKADARVEIVAICGRNKERAQEMADKYGIPNVFTDYRNMLGTNHLSANNLKVNKIAVNNLSAVVIATPDDEHCRMTMAALDAGLHVLCEKPLALNAKDAKAMYDKAEAKRLKHMTYFTWRWMPHYRYMRELIDGGVLGRIFHCEFTFLMGGGRNKAYQWRFDPKRANGVVGDSGSHMFDLARYLVGDVAKVNAHLASHVEREGLDRSANDSAMILAEFASGAQGIFQLSSVARVDDPFLEQKVTLHGEAGSLVAELRMGSTLKLQFAKGDEGFQSVTIPAHYLQGVDITQPFITQSVPMFMQQNIGNRLFVEAILEDKPVTPSFYEGWKAQQLIDATLASHEKKQWVFL